MSGIRVLAKHLSEWGRAGTAEPPEPDFRVGLGWDGLCKSDESRGHTLFGGLRLAPRLVRSVATVNSWRNLLPASGYLMGPAQKCGFFI